MKHDVIFGGTYNPPHLGHYMLIEDILGLECTDTVYIVPTGTPVHKAGLQLASSEHRIKMCSVMAANFDRVKVWDIEAKRQGKSYTYLTLLDYRRLYPDKSKPYLLCGGDMVITLPTWYKYDEFKSFCGVLAVYRKGENREAFDRSVEVLVNDGVDVRVLDFDIPDISSTFVRNLVYEEKDTTDYLHTDIIKYIKDNNLYRECTDVTVTEYKEHIKAKLTDRRYYHSLCVAEEAVRLADRYGGDKDKAYLAGLLHDVLKDTSPEKQLEYAKEFDLRLSEIELNAPKLYHSIIGAEYIKNVLKIEDEEIISAVRFHTTARAGMTLLEKILYLADYTSVDRDYDGVDEMREAVEVSLEAAMKEALIFTIDDLKAKGAVVHPCTLEAYKEYVK